MSRAVGSVGGGTGLRLAWGADVQSRAVPWLALDRRLGQGG